MFKYSLISFRNECLFASVCCHVTLAADASSLLCFFIVCVGSYRRPALALACNSGVFEEAQDSWAPTIKLLVDKDIPAVFTSYNELEATGEPA